MYEMWYGPKDDRRHVVRRTKKEIEREVDLLKEMDLDENVVVKEV